MAAAILTVTSASAADDIAAARAELAPTGVVRVAIGIGVSPSGFFATVDPETGEYRGVTVELGKALGEKLGMPIEFVPHQASGEIQASANDGTWDVTFMPVDEVRKQFVDFGGAFHLLQSTYLVRGETAIQHVSDANRAGVRIVGVAGTATFRASNASAPLATHISAAGQDEAIAMILAGEADAVALGRESLTGLVDRIPGGLVLESAFLNSSTAVAVPKDHPAALAFVTAFIEEAKESGLVRRAFDANGLESSVVAPLGMLP